MRKHEDYIKERMEKDSEFKRLKEERRFRRSIVKSLVKIRYERGLTQKGLADLTGLTQSVIARIEGGSINPTLDTIGKIVGVLGLHITIAERAETAPEISMEEK